MAVSGGQVVVDIIANTSLFTSGIAKAEAGLAKLGVTTQGVAAHQARWDAHTRRNIDSLKGVARANSALDNELRGYRSTIDAATRATERASGAHKNIHAHVKRTHIAFLGIRSSTLGMGVAILAGAQAFHHLQENLAVTGEKAFTNEGKIRNFAAALATLDIVGAVTALDATKTTGTVPELQKKLKLGFKTTDGVAADYNKVSAVTATIDAVASLIGIDRGRERQLERLTNLSKAYAESVGSIVAAQGAAAFHDSRSPGHIDLVNRRVGDRIRDVPGANPDGTLKAFHPFAGLTQQLQTAIAGAEAGGNVNKQLAQYSRAMAALKKQEKLGHLTDAQRETIFNAEKDIQGRIDGIYSDRASAAKQAADRARQLREQAAAKAKAARDSMASKLSDAISAMQDTLTSAVESQAGAFGSLFGGPVLNPTDGGATGGGHKGWFGALAGGKHSQAKSIAQKINADLDAQVGNYIKLGKNLTSLKKRGASGELISQLRDSHDLEKISALAGEKDGPLHHFFKQFNRGQALIKGAAAMSVQAKDVHLAAGVVHLTAGKGGGEGTIHVTVQMDGKTVAKHTVTNLQKNRKGKSGTRKGAHGGSAQGIDG